jgi:hypothetical protein
MSNEKNSDKINLDSAKAKSQPVTPRPPEPPPQPPKKTEKG